MSQSMLLKMQAKMQAISIAPDLMQLDSVCCIDDYLLNISIATKLKAISPIAIYGTQLSIF
jgi:hypothetical protein